MAPRTEHANKLSGHIVTIAKMIFGNPVRQSGQNFRYLKNASISVNSATELYFDFGADRGGDALDLIEHYVNGSTPDWIETFLAENPEKPAFEETSSDNADAYEAHRALIASAVPIKGTPAEVHLREVRGLDLTDPEPGNLLWLPEARSGEGALVAVACNATGKMTAVQLTYLTVDGRKSPRQPQRQTLPTAADWSDKSAFVLGDAYSAAEIILVEGTEDALAISLATETPVIAAWGVAHFRAPPTAKTITIVADYDPPKANGDAPASRQALEKGIDTLLLEVTDRIILTTPTPPAPDAKKNDAADMYRRDGAQALAKLIADAEPQTLTIEGWAKRLASVRLGVRGDLRARALAAIKDKYGKGAYTAKDLDRLVKFAEDKLDRDKAAKQADGAADDAQAEEARHAEPVSTTALIEMIEATLRRFVVMNSDDRLIVALYIVMTYVFETFDVCPKLLITAPVRAAGKSRLATVAGRMCHNHIVAANMTPSVLFRLIDQMKPTIVLAEADTWLKDNEELRGVINAGHARDEAIVWRSVLDPELGDYVPTQFSVFGPQIISGIGVLHGTVMSRGFVVRMRPRKSDEKIDKLRQRVKVVLDDVRPYCYRWADDNQELLAHAEPPKLPEHWEDRAEDNAEPLVMIAAIGGAELVARLTAALDKCFAREKAREEPTRPVELLAHVHQCFVENGENQQNGKMWGEEILAYLLNMEEAPWSTYSRGQQLSQTRMQTILRSFGLFTQDSKKARQNKRGMTYSAVHQAFEIYTPGGGGV